MAVASLRLALAGTGGQDKQIRSRDAARKHGNDKQSDAGGSGQQGQCRKCATAKNGSLTSLVETPKWRQSGWLR